MASTKPLSHICIVAAETSAWIAAATLAQGLKNLPIKITVVELNEKPIEASAESTLPSTNAFHHILQIPEKEILKQCDGTFKLATNYENWAKGVSAYKLPFSEHGFMLDSLDFQHYASRLQKSGDNTNFDAYSLSAVAAKLKRFRHPSREVKSLFRTIEYALHINTKTYSTLLKNYTLQQDCEVVTTDNIKVTLTNDSEIQSITLDNNNSIQADLYIDASGQQALLSEHQSVEYLDLSSQLPNNRVAVVEHQTPKDIPPYTSIIGCDNGWIRSVPLREKTETAFYFDKVQTDDSEAADTLQQYLRNTKADSETTDINYFDVKPGKRKNFWVGNCISIGKAAGYLDEFAVGQCHLAQAASLRLLELLPAFSDNKLNAQEYNRLTHAEYERILDFHSLHYSLANHFDSKYWQQCKQLELSASAKQKYDVFFALGKLAPFESETLTNGNWISFFLGQNLWPLHHDPYVDGVDINWIRSQLTRMKSVFAEAANAMPPHRVYLDQYCPLEE